jgi:hypothetical protein
VLHGVERSTASTLNGNCAPIGGRPDRHVSKHTLAFFVADAITAAIRRWPNASWCVPVSRSQPPRDPDVIKLPVLLPGSV